MPSRRKSTLRSSDRKKPRAKTGPRRLEPTDDQRRLVESHAAFGTPQEEICRLIPNPRTGKPISLKTLHDHFRSELDNGMTKANARVAESLYHQAVGRPAQFDQAGRELRSELKPNVAAGIFWAKARMGWKETDVHEHGGRGGAAAIPIRIDSLSSSQLDQLISRIEGGSA